MRNHRKSIHVETVSKVREDLQYLDVSIFNHILSSRNMYHISEDIRAKQSARRICEAVIICSRKKPFSEITVSDVARESLTSRTTFYRLFDNTVDVLEYMVDIMGEEVLMSVHGTTPKEVLINAIKALEERRELIELLSSSGHFDLFQEKQEKYFPLSQLAVGMQFGDSAEYFHAILAQMISAVLDVWMRHGCKDSPEAVHKKVCESIQMLSVLFSESR